MHAGQDTSLEEQSDKVSLNVNVTKTSFCRFQVGSRCNDCEEAKLRRYRGQVPWSIVTKKGKLRRIPRLALRS